MLDQKRQTVNKQKYGPWRNVLGVESHVINVQKGILLPVHEQYIFTAKGNAQTEFWKDGNATAAPLPPEYMKINENQ